jgi:hypothetical protein
MWMAIRDGRALGMKNSNYQFFLSGGMISEINCGDFSFGVHALPGVRQCVK